MSDLSWRFKLIIIAVYFVFSFLFMVLAFTLPFAGINIGELDYTTTISPSIINGLLTVNSIVFAFVAYEYRNIEKNDLVRAIAIATPLFLILLTVYSYCVEVVITTTHEPTILTMNIAAASCFLTIFTLIFGFIKKALWERVTPD